MVSISARALALLLEGWRATDEVAYAALAARIRLLVLDGRIALDARLPAERDLALALGVSRTTVTAAYARLRGSGYLSSTRGSGSVARLPLNRPTPVPSPIGELLDFSKAQLRALPVIAAASRRAAALLPDHLGGSGYDPVGIPALREAIADRYRARGLETSPDQIMVTLGAQHAIALIARTMLGRGDRVLVESPSYPHAYEALRDAGGRLVPVSVTTESGWDARGLEQAMARTNPTLGYLMPDFHNPTGQAMSAELRERVLALADRQGTTLIADETMAELAIDEPGPVLPFAASAHGLTEPISIGSVGKTVWGGLRIGWIRAERTTIQRLVRARAAGDLGTPVLEQLIVVELLGDYPAILRERAAELRAGRGELERLLTEQLPEWSVPHAAGGLTAWVNIGAPVSSPLALAARGEGLQIAAGPRFGLDGALERFLRIPFSYRSQETERAVAALARAWHSLGPLPEVENGYLAEVV